MELYGSDGTMEYYTGYDTGSVLYSCEGIAAVSSGEMSVDCWSYFDPQSSN